jgi:AcrR family transcriptional regulator
MAITAPSRSRPRRTDQYHHGDLRAALLKAAEAELAERGLESFSLRGVAKRAGVSHAAPAHHFRDVNGLLTALAAEGFRRFLEAQKARRRKAAGDPMSQLVASGLGYIDFAIANPALFRLMFSSDRPDRDAPEFHMAASAAYQQLVEDVRCVRGNAPGQVEPAPVDVMRTWAMAHGLADLMNSGRLKHLLGLRKAEREATLAEMLCKSLA